MLASQKKNSKGILLMLISMAAFAVGDTFVKISGSFLSPSQIMFFLISGGLIIFTLIALSKGERLRDRRAFSPILLIRYSAEMLGLVAMIMGLTKIPLSVVGTVTQASPILVAAGAVIFFKEAVSWRRWSSIIIGFFGVVLVIQPTGQSLDFAVIWPVVALVAFSVRDLVTRLTPSDIPSASIATFTMIAAFPFTVAWVFFSGQKFFPPGIDWAVVAGMIILGSIGYLLLITSLRIGDLSAIMPFRYSRIVFLLILGVLVFGERPTLSMLAGSALILISGLYIMWRERIVTKGLSAI
ncbi:EamA family transporter [bacterium]|nr:EamA family transporter [bacterium]MDT1987376.1 DMT family transporter [Planktomarina sp.]